MCFNSFISFLTTKSTTMENTAKTELTPQSVVGKVIYVDFLLNPSTQYPDFQAQKFGVQVTQMSNFQERNDDFHFQASTKTTTQISNALNIGDTVCVTFGCTGGKTKTDLNKAGSEKNPKNSSGLPQFQVVSIEIIKKAIGSGISAAPTQANSATPSPIAQPSGGVPKNGAGEDQIWNSTTGVWEDPLF